MQIGLDLADCGYDTKKCERYNTIPLAKTQGAHPGCTTVHLPGSVGKVKVFTWGLKNFCAQHTATRPTRYKDLRGCCMGVAPVG